MVPPPSHPDMDWGDMCEYIAKGFDSYEVRLGEYLAKHGGVLSKEVVKQIGNCVNIATEGKFDVHEMDVGTRGIEAAGKFHDELVKAQEMLLAQIHSQINI